MSYNMNCIMIVTTTTIVYLLLIHSGMAQIENDIQNVTYSIKSNTSLSISSRVLPNSERKTPSKEFLQFLEYFAKYVGNKNRNENQKQILLDNTDDQNIKLELPLHPYSNTTNPNSTVIKSVPNNLQSTINILEFEQTTTGGSQIKINNSATTVEKASELNASISKNSSNSNSTTSTLSATEIHGTFNKSKQQNMKSFLQIPIEHLSSTASSVPSINKPNSLNLKSSERINRNAEEHTSQKFVEYAKLSNTFKLHNQSSVEEQDIFVSQSTFTTVTEKLILSEYSRTENEMNTSTRKLSNGDCITPVPSLTESGIFKTSNKPKYPNVTLLISTTTKYPSLIVSSILGDDKFNSFRSSEEQSNEKTSDKFKFNNQSSKISHDTIFPDEIMLMSAEKVTSLRRSIIENTTPMDHTTTQPKYPKVSQFVAKHFPIHGYDHKTQIITDNPTIFENSTLTSNKQVVTFLVDSDHKHNTSTESIRTMFNNKPSNFSSTSTSDHFTSRKVCFQSIESVLDSISNRSLPILEPADVYMYVYTPPIDILNTSSHQREFTTRFRYLNQSRKSSTEDNFTSMYPFVSAFSLGGHKIINEYRKLMTPTLSPSRKLYPTDEDLKITSIQPHCYIFRISKNITNSTMSSVKKNIYREDEKTADPKFYFKTRPLHAVSTLPFQLYGQMYCNTSIGTFACHNGEACIPIAGRCNGLVECKDASDERYCTCVERLRPHKLCDGYYDCPVGEDEHHCHGNPVGTFNCGYINDISKWWIPHTYIPMSQRCDGIFDCPGGKDEFNCMVLTDIVSSGVNILNYYKSGYLHRNYCGVWYPFCELDTNVASRVCEDDSVYIFTKGKQIELNLLQYHNIYNNSFLVKGTFAHQYEFKGTCHSENIAVHVDCPAMSCGMRVTPSDLTPSYRFKRDESQKSSKGGHYSEPGSFPWVVIINKDGSFHCVGTIVEDSWVLTAAHCMNNFEEHYFGIRAGVTRRFSLSPNEQIRIVTRVFIHPKFETTNDSVINDIALLKLASPLMFSQWVSKICLPYPHQSLGLLPGSWCTAIGWGEENIYQADYINGVDLEILDHCWRQTDTDNDAICAGNLDHNICYGDGGSPLLCRKPGGMSPTRSQWYVAGVMSHGGMCPGVIHWEPAVYTQVVSYSEWIVTLTTEEHIIPFAHQPKQYCPGIRCKIGDRCVDIQNICDGCVDCPDAEDEIGCNFIESEDGLPALSSYVYVKPLANRLKSFAMNRTKASTNNLTMKPISEATHGDSPSSITDLKEELLDKVARYISSSSLVSMSSSNGSNITQKVCFQSIETLQNSVARHVLPIPTPANIYMYYFVPPASANLSQSQIQLPKKPSLYKASIDLNVTFPNDTSEFFSVYSANQQKLLVTYGKKYANSGTMTDGQQAEPCCVTINITINGSRSSSPFSIVDNANTETRMKINFTGVGHDSRFYYKKPSAGVLPFQLYGIKNCNNESFSCLNNAACVPMKHVCNGLTECEDASDERNCSCRTRINEHTLCDGFQDCPNGEDEIGCHGCPKHTFDCGDRTNFMAHGTCFPMSDRCDGKIDCPGGKDELGCYVVTDTVTTGNVLRLNPFKSGYLHRNYKGTWYPVCDPDTLVATKACEEEEQFWFDKEKHVEIEYLPYNNDYAGPFIVQATSSNELEFEFVPYCQDKNVAVHVKCPVGLCGTRASFKEVFVPLKRAKRNVDGDPADPEDIEKLASALKNVFPKLVSSSDYNNDRRVVGGKSSQPGDWPWIVLIQRDGILRCGGTIISDDYVMTAAHCFEFNKADNFQQHHFEILAGMTRRSSFSPSEQVRTITRIFIHPEFNTDFKNDIALVRLELPLKFSKWVHPICFLGGDKKSRSHPSPGTFCTVVGWGKVTEHGQNADNVKEVELPILNHCKHVIDKDSQSICAGFLEGGLDACQGDSGGPLLCRNPSLLKAGQEQWYVAGIVSHGNGCARQNEPGVYTNVALYVDWIGAVISGDHQSGLFTRGPRLECPGIRCQGRCIAQNSICDGHVDCLYAEDEIGCTFLHKRYHLVAMQHIDHMNNFYGFASDWHRRIQVSKLGIRASEEDKIGNVTLGV